jgi:hypothetical protein
VTCYVDDRGRREAPVDRPSSRSWTAQPTYSWWYVLNGIGVQIIWNGVSALWLTLPR